MVWILRLALICFGIAASLCTKESFNWDRDYKLKIVTVATEETEGYLRFIRSAKIFDLDVEVFGLNEEWLGGDMANGPGGGFKINVLRTALEKYKDDKDMILMFTDSYDVVFASGKDEILEKFKKSGANILISAEDFCWPDRSLKEKYPKFSGDGYRYLCSGGIIGFAPLIYEIITKKTVSHTDDDQLYYTHIYLEDRDKYNIKLDRQADLFQNLNGAKDHVELLFEGPDVRVVNNRFKTTPVIIHGNGPSKLYLNHLGNYVPKAWSYDDGCLSCNENKISLQDIPRKDWPNVLIGLYVPQLTPFLDSFLMHIANLDYPKDKIDIFLFSAEDFHDKVVESWIQEFEKQYKSLTYEGPKSFLSLMQARNLGIYQCRKIKCEYYFSVDSIVSLTNRLSLQLLIEQNRPFLTPMLSKPAKYWTNFWGEISQEGFYARSPDYLEIVKNQRLGVWNAPYVSDAYLINSTIFDKVGVSPYHEAVFDHDLQFCADLRDKGVFMHVTNMEHFGHLKEMDTFTTIQKHNDMFQVFDNKLDWEDKYLHPNYTLYLSPDGPTVEPCQDVFWVPMFTRNFTAHLIDECEHLGDWSGGGHKDERIAGGYENVPTVDIHMNQIGFEKHWLYILKTYFAPMATRLFAGFYSKSEAIMNFVVKYTPTGQYYLRPHHDASTYTVNLALNEPGVDYEGGGARFLRYNCSIAGTKVGWALLHPGRLTHQHEGLETTKGTRYIMVSFVDP